MLLYSNSVSLIYSTLGSVDTENPPSLSYKSVRKNTRAEVLIDPIVIVDQNERWIKWNCDGSLFEIGEHNYEILDGTTVVENGILIVRDGTKEAIPEYEGALEGEKGEYVS